MKRLSDGMKNEIRTIDHRIIIVHAQFLDNAPVDQSSYMLCRLNSQHGYELETYKVRLENFYSETDVKEQTFHDFQTYLWNNRRQDYFPVNFIR